MKAKLISYDLSKVNQIGKVIVKRQLFGFTEYSNNAKYTYKRSGILSAIPHLKLARAVIVVPKEQAPKVEKVIRSVRGKFLSLNMDIKSSMLH